MEQGEHKLLAEFSAKKYWRDLAKLPKAIWRTLTLA
jgi:hypothetical protein